MNDDEKTKKQILQAIHLLRNTIQESKIPEDVWLHAILKNIVIIYKNLGIGKESLQEDLGILYDQAIKHFNKEKE